MYVSAPGEFQLRPDHLLNVLKPLYGLSDAGDYLNKTSVQHITKNISMRPMSGYISVFVRTIQGAVAFMVVIYVDESLVTGEEELKEQRNFTLATF